MENYRPAYQVTLDDGRVVDIPEFTYDHRSSNDWYISPERWEADFIQAVVDPENSFLSIPF